MSLVPNFAGGSDGKVSAYNAEDPGWTPKSGRSSGEGNGNPLQYFHPENPMDGGAWWATQSMGSQRVRHNWANFTFTFGSKSSLLFYLIKFSWDSWQIKTDDFTNLHPLLFLTCTSFHPWTAKKWTMNWHQVFYTVGFYTSQLFLPWRIQFTKAYLEFSPSRSLEAGEKHQLYSNVLFLFTF